jgi:hypothetical protein
MGQEDSAGSSSTINADQHQVVDRGFDQPHHNQPYHNQMYHNQQHQNQQYHNNLHIQRQDDGSGTGRYSEIELNITGTTGRMSDRSRKRWDFNPFRILEISACRATARTHLPAMHHPHTASSIAGQDDKKW